MLLRGFRLFGVALHRKPLTLRLRRKINHLLPLPCRDIEWSALPEKIEIGDCAEVEAATYAGGHRGVSPTVGTIDSRQVVSFRVPSIGSTCMAMQGTAIALHCGFVSHNRSPVLSTGSGATRYTFIRPPKTGGYYSYRVSIILILTDYNHCRCRLPPCKFT